MGTDLRVEDGWMRSGRGRRSHHDSGKRSADAADVARDGEIHACYEASGAGSVLHRALAEWGYACDVIAPSLIPKRSGVHRKHDKRVGGRPDAAVSRRRARGGAHSDSREDSSGTRQRLGSITKAGNSHCRHVLLQSAWSDRHRPQTSVDLKRRQAGQPPAVIGHAWKAQQRLRARYNHLPDRKRPQIAVVAVAREVVGVLWAVMRELEPVQA